MIYRLRNLANNHAYAVPPGDVVVGRCGEVQIFIDHESVSRKHAIIHNFPNGVWIEDLQTTNGTLVRGELIKQSIQLQPGEIFQIGLVDFRLDPEIFDDAHPPLDTDDAEDSIEKLKRKTKTNNVLANREPVKIEYKVNETQSVSKISSIGSTLTGKKAASPVEAKKSLPTGRKSLGRTLFFVGGVILGLVAGVLLAKLLIH
ncbi:MAG: FHA domain-containing protein [Verrucomicrobiales bacterium]|jgi:hypothetical protein|nr:FHA domain-containing protein [Verrucomicrobiales bacterium]